MLVNPIFEIKEWFGHTLKKIDDGIYDAHFNLHNYIGNVEFEDNYPDLPNNKCNFGVADNIQQVLDFYKEEIASQIPYCIDVTLVKKSEQKEYGWRWRKWGKYIGTQQPTCQYLKDEPIIEEVVVFSVYRIRHFIKPTKQKQLAKGT